MAVSIEALVLRCFNQTSATRKNEEHLIASGIGLAAFRFGFRKLRDRRVHEMRQQIRGSGSDDDAPHQENRPEQDA
jgi:hypothetical protein